MLELEHPMPGAQWIEELANILNLALLPIIERGGSLTGLQEMIDIGVFKGAGAKPISLGD